MVLPSLIVMFVDLVPVKSLLLAKKQTLTSMDRFNGSMLDSV